MVGLNRAYLVCPFWLFLMIVWRVAHVHGEEYPKQITYSQQELLQVWPDVTSRVNMDATFPPEYRSK